MCWLRPGAARTSTFVAAVMASVIMGGAWRAHAQSRPLASGASSDRNWSATLADSVRLLMLEHGVRIAAQGKTRRELTGPFWRDWSRSVRWPQQWSDGDGWRVNNVGHPVHGAAAGWLWLEHGPTPAPGTWGYLKSRLTAAAFAGAYSLQFEIGPVSEASIGNVGLRPDVVGWSDWVLTPVGGFGIMLLEDAADRWVLAWIERRTNNAVVLALARMTLNPGRGMARLAQGRAPWGRSTDGR